jgi:hypothetical protein
MPSDMLWAPRFTGFEYVMRTKGSEQYIYEIIELEIFWSIIMIPHLYENLNLGVGVDMVIEEEQEFIFGAYVE